MDGPTGGSPEIFQQKPRRRSFNPQRDAKEVTKLNLKTLILTVIKAGPIVATGALFYTFMGVLFHGKFVWAEPNIAILTFEIVLSALWFIGSLLDLAQTVIKMQKK